MEINDKTRKKLSPAAKKSPYLHSADHMLADELSQKFNEPKRFGFYLKMATTHNHAFLRRIAGSVLETKAKNHGALFTYLVKKETDQNGA